MAETCCGKPCLGPLDPRLGSRLGSSTNLWRLRMCSNDCDAGCGPCTAMLVVIPVIFSLATFGVYITSMKTTKLS